jgi:hypothetical protein
MKKSKAVIIENLLATISVALFLWVFISWMNVLITNHHAASWNFFRLITTTSHAEQPKEQSSHIAKHEQFKGESKIKFVQKYEYSQDNVWYLSHVIAAEAGADWTTDEAVFYVGSVVLNRVESSSFPNSIKEVVLQPGQYATVPYLSRYEPSERVMEVTYELLNEGSVLPENVVYQANFKQGSGVYDVQNSMYFCYQ